ncbi:hypothetical protein LY90DRAFT_503866 [Neocallimastix californiae]|uniref:Uncharacterized protein n=1 Tax=Neocallimastix californiae TaxID=1754190 RepID=A0A1Y2ENB2_9FUNG|nr:hypothetical protein LY90DRAFT_503866 [Neocallimastix californiae]|eukprot:ORY72335.1 hypothetical protein LY90DRAFT_503866 [Neocallimastix californiae]
MSTEKEKKQDNDVVINIQKSTIIDNDEELIKKNNKEKNNKKKNDMGYIYFIYFNLFFIILAVIFDIYKFFHNLENSLYNWLYFPFFDYDGDDREHFRYPMLKLLQLVGILIVTSLLSIELNININKLIKNFPKEMLWTSRILLDIIFLGIAIPLIFYLPIKSIFRVFGFIILVIGAAIDENIHYSMDNSINLLKDYINFSKNSKKEENLGVYLSNVYGKIVIGIFIATGFMAIIPLGWELFPRPYYNDLYKDVYKYDEENLAYYYNFIACGMSIFFLYICCKFIMNVISCTISGTYAKLNLTKYYDPNQLNQEDLIKKYLKKSLKICYGTIVAQPINHIIFCFLSVIEFIIILIFGLPFYIFVIIITFLPLFATFVITFKIPISTILIILAICILLSFLLSQFFYNIELKLKMQYVNTIHNMNFINVILDDKSFYHSYKGGLIFPDIFTIPQKQKIPFFDFYKLHKTIKAPFVIKLMRFLFALISTAIITGITIAINMIFSKDICGFIIIATAITEFCTFIISFHPYVSGVQTIMYCKKIKEKEEKGNLNDDSDSECDYKIEYELDSDSMDNNCNDNTDYMKDVKKSESISNLENDDNKPWN